MPSGANTVCRDFCRPDFGLQIMQYQALLGLFQVFAFEGGWEVWMAEQDGMDHLGKV